MGEERPGPDPDVVESGQRSDGAWRGVIPVVLLAVGGITGYLVGNVSSGPDISEEGQVSFGCALAADLREDHRSGDDWGDLGEDRAFNEFFAVRSLLGGAVPPRDDDADSRFAELHWDAYADGPSAWGGLLEDVVEACEKG